MTRLLERDALLKGMAVAIVICLPLALVSNIVRDNDDESALLPLLFLAVAAGFAAAGWTAARSAQASPYSNGAVAALLGFLVIQAVAIVVRLAGDEPIGFSRIIGTALIAYASGLLGALLASRRARP